jgi:hypothetical protein
MRPTHTALESSGLAASGAEAAVRIDANVASEVENETENEKDDGEGEGEYEAKGQGNEDEDDEENVPENFERSRTKRVIVQLKVSQNRIIQNRIG